MEENNTTNSVAAGSYELGSILLFFAVKHQGDWYKIYDSVKNKERVDIKVANQLRRNYKGKFVTYLDSEYPRCLRDIKCAPFVLFYKGNYDLLKDSKTITIVGSRDCSNYGSQMARELTKGLVKNGYTIISGLAKGIDSIAHKVTLENKGRTIAVVGQGLDIYYPLNNKSLYDAIINNGGLIISEYPLGVASLKEHFPARNRILAGLGHSCLVVEASKRSGSLITVRNALDKGKDIYCVPARAYDDSGCNMLIKDGAYLVESVQDILDNDQFY